MSYKIVKKADLNSQIYLMEIEAPLVAKKAAPGQFVILRIDEKGERVPFTIADFNKEKGTVTVIIQAVGKTTRDLSKLNEGDTILDFAGPLGMPTPLEGLKKVAVIGGGLGTAIAYPQAKKLKDLGAEVTAISGFRSKEYIILDNEMNAVSDKLIITTDDGSNGVKGFVTNAYPNDYTYFYTCGPEPMLKAIYNASLTEGQFSFEERMGCGFGACMGCSCKTKYKNIRICKDGPVLDKEIIVW